MTRDELKRNVDIDLAAMRECVALLLDVRRKAASAPVVSPHDTAAASAYLHSIFGGVENVLRQFLRYRGIPSPSGARSHVDLLQLFTRSRQHAGLPLLFDEDDELVSELRGFRHVFRSAYALDLDWERVRPLADQVESWVASFAQRALSAVDQI
jgi:hypothetical protein